MKTLLIIPAIAFALTQYNPPPPEEPSVSTEIQIERIKKMLAEMTSMELDRFRVDCKIIATEPEAFPEKYSIDCTIGLKLLDLQNATPAP